MAISFFNQPVIRPLWSRRQLAHGVFFHLASLSHVPLYLLSHSLEPAVGTIPLSHIDCTFIIPPSQYRKLRKLGKGACGDVYEGSPSSPVFTIRLYNEHEVAIKECEVRRDTDMKQIIGELKVMTKLKHYNVIRNYGYNIHKEDNKTVITYIMEKAEGDLKGKLGDLVPVGQEKPVRPAVDFKTKKLYIFQIATGLFYTFQQSVYHSDLKMDNILLVDGDCKIADFGLSKIIEESG